MGLFGNQMNNDDINGFVVNLAQKEPYNGNYFVGLMPEGYPNPMRGDRMDIKFHPAGAKSREESQRLVSAKPKENAVFSYPAGMIDPQPVHVILPDNATAMPSPFFEAQYEDVPSLGAIFDRIHFKNQVVMEMLRATAKQNPQQVKEMKQTYMNSDLTSEKKLQEISQVVETVLSATNSKNRRQK